MKFLETRPCLEHIERFDTTAATCVATVASKHMHIDNGIGDQLKRVVYKEIGNMKNPPHQNPDSYKPNWDTGVCNLDKRCD